ncbi:hypothetical protein [Nitrosococcus oceani]|uniref:hypothetical protein n=1 Tax=Nitrosococcus oceani TaxID=1229 RepID=UPI0004E8CEFC|nr:hypothetical protein [Nitrosococcus oceani]KFI22337.1 hypothetical protein HW44_10120 [Nitrosococcus oceani]
MFKLFKNFTRSRSNEKSISSLSEEQLDALINFIANIIFTQKQLIVNQNGGSLPENATDEWSIGYVYGVVDTSFQVSNISMDSSSAELIKQVYNRTFGNNKGSEFFNTANICASIFAEDMEFTQGCKAGHYDVIENINSEEAIKLSWWRHILQNNSVMTATSI